MTQHSSIGGSIAARIIACPASVGLTAQMPKPPSSTFADEGTLLHEAMALVLEEKLTPAKCVGLTYNGITLTKDLLEEKLLPALEQFDAVVGTETEFMVEQKVSYGALIPDAFGTADVVGRRGDTAIILDHKFGHGLVKAEENSQLSYYADAARLTPATQWAFDGANEVEFVIVQPAAEQPSRWTAPLTYLDDFRAKLLLAVKLSEEPMPPFNAGDHCKWCAGRAKCPILSGAAERALATALDNLGDVGPLLEKADLLEQWLKSVNDLAQQMLESGRPVSGYKLVQKRAVRCWVDESEARTTLQKMGIDPITQGLISPAQAEKALKPLKLELPAPLVKAVSSGTTVAKDSDPRPGISNVSQKLNLSLSKLKLGN